MMSRIIPWVHPVWHLALHSGWGNGGSFSSLVCSDIYLMEKDIAKEQERNNRHRPPKIMEPSSFQDPPPKVGRTRGICCGTSVPAVPAAAPLSSTHRVHPEHVGFIEDGL